MVKKQIRMWWALLLCAGTAVAHEHWIDADSFYPEAGTTTAVHLCSGHYFPKSSFALKDNVLAGITAYGPDAQAMTVATDANEKQRTGSLTLATSGAYQMRFSLKRPHAATPSYEGTALFVAGNTGDDTNRYARGMGLELIPGARVSELRPGDEVTLSLRLDGQPIAGTLSVSEDGGRTYSLRTQPDRPAALKLRQPGRHIVTTSHEGRGCSLVFMVKEPQ